VSGSGAVSAVLAEFDAGATSLSEISERTGLGPELVRLAVERLVALGRITRERLDTGCEDACGRCAIRPADGADCGAAGRGPVLLRLTAAGR